MRRALFAFAVLAPIMAAAYACSTDTFAGGDAGADGGGVTQADFCDAEALYLHQCSFDDAACAQADLKNCGAVYAAYTPEFLAALVHCIDIGQAECTGDPGKLLASSCMQQALAGYSNDSGALAALAQDYCKACKPGTTGCEAQFVTPLQVGYVASFFADGVIQQMDTCEKQLDGGKINVADASLSCDDQTKICEYAIANNSLPSSACNDE